MKYVEILNELTDKECRVFLYCKILGLPPGYTSRVMETSTHDIQKIKQTIDHDKEVHKILNKINL